MAGPGGTESLPTPDTSFADRDALENSFLRILDLEPRNPNFSGLDIGDSYAAILANCLRDRSGLLSLNLQHNDIGDEGIRAIVEALIASNATVGTVLASDNCISDDGAEAIARLITRNPNLIRIDLSNNYIRDRGASAIARCLYKGIGLKELDISNNVIGKTGAAALFRELCKPDAIRGLRLNMTQNPLTDYVYDCFKAVQVTQGRFDWNPPTTVYRAQRSIPVRRPLPQDEDVTVDTYTEDRLMPEPGPSTPRQSYADMSFAFDAASEDGSGLTPRLDGGGTPRSGAGQSSFTKRRFKYFTRLAFLAEAVNHGIDNMLGASSNSEVRAMTMALKREMEDLVRLARGSREMSKSQEQQMKMEGEMVGYAWTLKLAALRKRKLERLMDYAQKMRRLSGDRTKEYDKLISERDAALRHTDDLKIKLVQEHQHRLNDSKRSDEEIRRMTEEVQHTEITHEQARLMISELQKTVEILQMANSKLSEEKNELEMHQRTDEGARRDAWLADKVFLEAEVVRERESKRVWQEERESMKMDMQDLKETEVRLNDEIAKYKDLNEVREEFIRKQLESDAEIRVQLTRKLKEAEQTRDSFMAKCQDLEFKFRETSERCRGLEAHNDDLSLRLEQANSRIEELSEIAREVDFLRREKDRLDSEVAELSVENDRLKEKERRFEAEMDIARRKIQDLEAHKERLEHEVIDIREKCDAALMAVKVDMERVKNEAHGKLVSANDRVANALKEANTAFLRTQTDINELLKNMGVTGPQIPEEFVNVIHRKAQEFDQVSRELASVRQELKDTQGQMDRLRKSEESAKERLNEANRQAESSFTKLKDAQELYEMEKRKAEKLVDMPGINASLKEELNRLRGEVEPLRALKDKISGEKAAADRQINEKSNELDKIRKEKSDVEKRLKTVEDQNKDLSRIKEEVEQRLGTYQQIANQVKHNADSALEDLPDTKMRKVSFNNFMHRAKEISIGVKNRSRLQWSVDGKKAKSIDLNNVWKVDGGKGSKLLAEYATKEQDDSCFVICIDDAKTGLRTLDLIAPDRDARDRWVHNLKAILISKYYPFPGQIAGRLLGSTERTRSAAQRNSMTAPPNAGISPLAGPARTSARASPGPVSTSEDYGEWEGEEMGGGAVTFKR